MERRILDGNLDSWEPYATTGMFGYSEPARIVFRCLSDATERARALYMGDKAEAERVVRGSSDEELRELLAKAEPVD